MTKRECQLIRTDKELATVASKMRAYARKNPLSEEQVRDLMELEDGEYMGVMLKVQDSTQAGSLAEKYSSFAIFSSKQPIPYQVTYLEYVTSAGRLLQLTLNNGFQQPVTRGLVSRMASFFFDSVEDIKFVHEGVPEHIAILIQKDEEYAS